MKTKFERYEKKIGSMIEDVCNSFPCVSCGDPRASCIVEEMQDKLDKKIKRITPAQPINSR